ncbi:MAG: hypothetical protein ACREV2_15815, partial [Burkholderiales bacterium]
SSLARSQPEAQPVGVEEPAATITHAKEVASGQEVALEGFVKPPAAVAEHLGTSHALEKPKTAPISRERPDQQFAPRPIPVLDRTTGGDSGGGGAQSVPEATSGKFPAEKVQKPDANSIPKIADDKPGSPKTNSVATAAKPIQQALKKVKPALINAKRDENRTQKPSANESPAERAEISVQVIGIKEHGPIAGIVDRIERTPERPENNATDTKGLGRRDKRASEIERAGTAELVPPAGLSDRAERAAKVERALVKAVERIEQVERPKVGRPERGERVERAEVSRPDRVERTERFERPNLERPERERVERPERAERVERPERVERVERAERPEKLERIERKLLEKAERILRAERR